MAYRVVVAAPAERDVDGAVTYLCEEFCSPTAARRLLETFGEVSALLAQTPCAFPVRRDVSDAVGQEIRWAPVTSYGIYYRVNEAERRVDIVAFLHGLQDAPTAVKERL